MMKVLTIVSFDRCCALFGWWQGCAPSAIILLGSFVLEWTDVIE